MRQNLIRRGTIPTLCAVAALGLTACQGQGADVGAAPSSTQSSAGTPRATPAQRTPEPLTGNQLTEQLAPASFFPSGLAVDLEATRDTGPAYQPQTVENPPKAECSILDTTGWVTVTGIAGISFTQENRLDKDTSTEVAQGIDVFKGATSSTVLDALSKVSGRCPSFTDDDTHTKVKVSVKPLAGIGDGAYTITLSCAAWRSNTTLIAARVGSAVISVLSTDGTGHDGSIIAKKVAGHIAAGLQGKA